MKNLDATNQTPLADPPSARNWGVSALIDGLWRTLVDFRLLLVAVAVTLLFALIALNLPQLPDQLRTDPGDANRWLLATAERSGALGEVLRTVGLFNLLHSPFFQLALAFIGLLLLLQLAYSIGNALQTRQIARTALAQPSMAGAPAPLPPGRRIYRLRTTLDNGLENRLLAPENSVIADELTPFYPSLTQDQLTVTPPVFRADMEEAGPVTETRLLALRKPWAATLRPLLAAGLLLCVAALWLLARQGWEITVPTLAPGETFRYVAGGLELRYDVAINEATGRATPTLLIDTGTRQERLLLEPGAWTQVGGVTVAAAPAAPALLVRTRGSQPMLAQPGQSTPSMTIGLLFPGPGSEQALLLPRQGAGLRILRATDGSTGVNSRDGADFVVELYRRNAVLPDLPVRVRADAPQYLVLDDGQIIDFLPVRGVRITARRQPGIWLLLPALLLCVVGLAGYWLRPGFVLVQVAPWSRTKDVLIVQSDRQATINDLERLLEAGTVTQEKS